MIVQDLFEAPQLCPECGGVSFSDLILAEKKDACYYKVKASAKVWPSAYASGRLVQCRKKGADNYGNSKNEGVAEGNELAEEFDLIESIIDRLAEHNGVDAELVWEDLESLTDDELYVFAVTTPLMEDWQKANKRDRTDGMSRKAVNAYRRENPGSKLKTAVTTKPSKLKRGSKASKRRKSYCSRSRGQMKMHSISCAKTPDKAICKARRRWNCESIDFNLAEMDKTQTSPGRDGDIDWTKKQIHLGPEHVIKAKDVAQHALKALDKTMKKSHADTPKKKGVAEAGIKFNGGFPDVDHMNGPRGINLPSVPTKKFFTDKKQWQQAVDDINSSKYDDNSEYTGVTGRSTVSIDGHEWARWSDAQQKGYIELSSMSEQGVAEGYDDEDEGNPVMNAIISRIMRTRPDLLDYDMHKLQAAIRDVALDVGDVDEIGSSDISGWVKRVEQNLSGAGVSEAINPDITNPAFSHEQQIGDYLYVARYWSKGLKITAYDGAKQIGYAELMYQSAPFDDFADPKTTPKRIWLESEWTRVDPKYQRQGIMSTMYAYAKMLGNSVKPSQTRSDDAKAAWKSWRDAGDAQHLTREGVAEGSEQVYRVLAVDKSNALSKQVKLKVKASSLDEVFERLAISDWYPLEINGVEVVNGKRLKQGVAEGSFGQNVMQYPRGSVVADKHGNRYTVLGHQGRTLVVKGVVDGKRVMLFPHQLQQGVAEAGPFSYGKAPRKGSVADQAAKKRREQERGKQPIEPKDQQVGVAKVTKGIAEVNNEKIGGRYDPEEFDSMMQRLKKLAGAGPMKTVYDPQRRVYRNMPVAQQPDKK